MTKFLKYIHLLAKKKKSKSVYGRISCTLKKETEG